MTIEPETKSWTWVLERTCEECGFDTQAFPREETGELLRQAAEPWPAFLSHASVRTRPRDDCWSALEYGCHVRDVFRMSVYRLGRMLGEDNPRFDNWDQDETAVTDRYDLQDPHAVADEIVATAAGLADRYDSLDGQQWSRPGTRSDGAEFTVDSFGRYVLHDLVHHIVDVRRELGYSRIVTEISTATNFATFEESTREDWAIIMKHVQITQTHVADNVIAQMRQLRSDYGGFPVDRLEHSLQTATRAERAGRDDEYVLCALLHDIGDNLAPYNHPSIAAGILKPFVSEANHWMVEHHGIFQGYYFWHHIGLDKDAREAYRDSPYFDLTEEFCALYDQTAFDATYVSEPLEHFEPLIRAKF